MEFRKAFKRDIPEIMTIIKQAQEYFKNHGIDQWQNNYPNEDVVNNDIENKENYVMIKDDKVVATTVLSFKEEEYYNNITEGKWLTDKEYGVIHRIAVDSTFKGLGYSHKLIKYMESLCLEKDIHSLRVDTHEKNMTMKGLLIKNSFQYCGVVYLEDGSKRVAFEKELS